MCRVQPRRRAKPFIDKKDSECFTLVARSQLDPLFYDDTASKNVLVSSAVRAVGDKFAQPRTSGADDDADDARSAATGRGSVATRATKKSGRWGGRRGAEDDARSTVSTRSRARVKDLMAAPVGAAGARRIHELSEVDEQGFPLDGYDYSQHLTEGGDSGVFIAASGEVYASGVHFTHARAAQFNLPQEVLPCKPEDEVDRMLEAIVLKPESMPADLREVMDAIEEAEEELDAEDFGAFVINPADVVGSTGASTSGTAGAAGAGASAGADGVATGAAAAVTSHKPVKVKQRVQRGTQAFDVEELDDEFVLQATGEVEFEGGDAVDESAEAGTSAAGGAAAASKMSKNSKYREPAEFDFEAHMARLMAAAEGKWTDTNDDFDDDDDFYGEEEEEDADGAYATTGGFTRPDAGGVRYSDALLNAVMAQYEDDQIGELDENDPRLRSDAAWLAFGNNAALANAKRLAEEAGEDGEEEYDEHAGFDEAAEDAFLEAGEEEEEEEDALPEAVPINNDQLLERLVSDYLIEKEENRRDMLLMNGVGVRTDRKRATASKAPLHPEDVLRVPKRDTKSSSSVAGSSVVGSSDVGVTKPAGSSAFGINFGALAALSASGTKAAVPVRAAGVVESKAAAEEEGEEEEEEDDDYLSADGEHASHHGYSEGEDEDEEDEAERIMRDRTGYQLDENGDRIIPFGFGEGDFVYDESIPALPLPKEKPRWDAETIVSTYTNTENHPRPLTDGVSITSSRTGFMAKSLASVGAEAADAGAAHSNNMIVSSYGTPVIRLSKKTGLPVRSAPSAKVAAARAASRLAAEPIAEEGEGAEEADGSASEGEEASGNSGAAAAITKRNKDETVEEKRARKAAAKNARRERRADKKVLRDAYKFESLRQSAMAHARNAVASGATLE